MNDARNRVEGFWARNVVGLMTYGATFIAGVVVGILVANAF